MSRAQLVLSQSNTAEKVPVKQLHTVQTRMHSISSVIVSSLRTRMATTGSLTSQAPPQQVAGVMQAADLGGPSGGHLRRRRGQ